MTNKSIEPFNDEERVGSLSLAQGLEKPHDNIRDLIAKYRDKFEDLGAVKRHKKESTGGRPLWEYLLTFDHVLFLFSVMRNLGPAPKLKCDVIKAGTLVAAISMLKTFDFGDSQQKFVYAAIDAQQRVKIGISNNPEERIKNLNIGNADDLELVFTKKATNKGYTDEILLHSKCGEFKIRSEWFDNRALEVLDEETN